MGTIEQRDSVEAARIGSIVFVLVAVQRSLNSVTKLFELPLRSSILRMAGFGGNTANKFIQLI